VSVCNELLLSLYVDGEATLPQRRQVDLHIQQCASCRQALDDLTRINATLTEWGSRKRSVPVGADIRLARKLRRRRALRPILAVSKLTPAALGSAIAAVLVLASANSGLLLPKGSGGENIPYASVSSAIASQSSPLRNERRMSAVLGVRIVRHPVLPLRHRLPFGVE